MRNKLWVGVLLLVAMASLSWLAAQTQRREGTLYMLITSDDPWRVEAALTLATRAQEHGYRVVVHLHARGVKIANKHAHQASPELVNSQRQLQSLLQKGVKVYVCPGNSRRAGMKVPDDWISGVSSGSPEVIDLMMAPNTKVVSY